MKTDQQLFNKLVNRVRNYENTAPLFISYDIWNIRDIPNGEFSSRNIDFLSEIKHYMDNWIRKSGYSLDFDKVVWNKVYVDGDEETRPDDFRTNHRVLWLVSDAYVAPPIYSKSRFDFVFAIQYTFYGAGKRKFEYWVFEASQKFLGREYDLEQVPPPYPKDVVPTYFILHPVGTGKLTKGAI